MNVKTQAVILSSILTGWGLTLGFYGGYWNATGIFILLSIVVALLGWFHE